MSGISSQISEPRLIVNSSLATWPSSETNGGSGTGLLAARCGVSTSVTPSSSSISVACSSIAPRSSSVRPDAL